MASGALAFPFEVAVVGAVGSGKSSLVGCMLPNAAEPAPECGGTGSMNNPAVAGANLDEDAAAAERHSCERPLPGAVSEQIVTAVVLPVVERPTSGPSPSTRPTTSAQRVSLPPAPAPLAEPSGDASRASSSASSCAAATAAAPAPATELTSRTALSSPPPLTSTSPQRAQSPDPSASASLSASAASSAPTAAAASSSPPPPIVMVRWQFVECSGRFLSMHQLFLDSADAIVVVVPLSFDASSEPVQAAQRLVGELSQLAFGGRSKRLVLVGTHSDVPAASGPDWDALATRNGFEFVRLNALDVGAVTAFFDTLLTAHLERVFYDEHYRNDPSRARDIVLPPRIPRLGLCAAPTPSRSRGNSDTQRRVASPGIATAVVPQPHPDAEGAPLWVDDDACVDCQMCGRRFTLFIRRHHCRKCGSLFCKECCHVSIMIPAMGYTKPVKVCNSCLTSSPPNSPPPAAVDGNGPRLQ